MEKILVEVPKELGSQLRKNDITAISDLGNPIITRGVKTKKVNIHVTVQYTTINNKNFIVNRTTVRIPGHNLVLYTLGSQID